MDNDRVNTHIRFSRRYQKHPAEHNSNDQRLNGRGAFKPEGLK